VLGVKYGFTKVGISAIVEAEHQPGPAGHSLVEGPINSALNGSHHAEIGSHVEAMGAGHGGQSSLIFKAQQIVVASTTNPLNPTPFG